ncbi:MAG: 6-phosphogluconolactonase [Ginsengibacter sp.]
MNVKVFPSEFEVNEALAEWTCNLIIKTLKSQEYFTMALSGGNTPRLLFQKLASKKYIDKIDWKRVHVFWGDERMVPADDDRNNAKMAFENLLQHTDIPEKNVHRIRVDIEPLFAAEDYNHRLHNYFDNRSTSFDLIFLGLGEDGHTLSLFPGSGVIEETNEWVSFTFNEKQEARVTLLPVLVNKSSFIVFLVAGEKKAAIVQRVLEETYQPLALPAQIIKPVNGELFWFLDEDAAQKLTP